MERQINHSSEPLAPQQGGRFEEWFRFFSQDSKLIERYVSLMDTIVRECRGSGLQAIFVYNSPNRGEYFVCLIWKERASWQSVFGGADTPPSPVGHHITLELERLTQGRYVQLGARGVVWELPTLSVEVRQWNPLCMPIPH